MASASSYQVGADDFIDLACSVGTIWLELIDLRVEFSTRGHPDRAGFPEQIRRHGLAWIRDRRLTLPAIAIPLVSHIEDEVAEGGLQLRKAQDHQLPHPP